MVKKVVGINEKCTGCRICVLACSLHLEGVFNPRRARLAIASGYNAKDEPNICFQCEDAPCAEACPTEAITLNGETGIWHVDREKCTACGECIDVCPYDAIFFEPEENYVLKCEVCSGAPCVQECPNAALSLEG